MLYCSVLSCTVLRCFIMLHSRHFLICFRLCFIIEYIRVYCIWWHCIKLYHIVWYEILWYSILYYSPTVHCLMLCCSVLCCIIFTPYGGQAKPQSFLQIWTATQTRVGKRARNPARRPLPACRPPLRKWSLVFGCAFATRHPLQLRQLRTRRPASQGRYYISWYDTET